MIAIDELSGGRRFVRDHLRDLTVGKAIGLEIREAPVGVAKTRAGRCRGPIRLDGFFPPSQGLERMGNRQMQIGCLGRVDQKLLVEGNGLLMLAEANTGPRVQRLVLSVGGLDLQKGFELPARRRVLMALCQHEGKIVTGSLVAWGEL